MKRVYIDTSVIGGCFDYLFEDASRRLIDRAVNGEIMLLISDHAFVEINRAPEQVSNIVKHLPARVYEEVLVNAEARRLMQVYMEERIVTRKSQADALHVACATIAKADAIVSWNFKHIVNFVRSRRFNEINERQGYKPLQICTPKEFLGP